MKKSLPLFLAALFLAFQSSAQNVGIGTNNPQTKLQVEGAISSAPTSAPAQAAYVIPDNTSVFRLTAVGGAQVNALSMATPHEGQYLIIFNQDDNAATFSGFTLSGGATMTLNYINAAWRLTARSDAFGPSGTQGPTGPQGNTGPAGATGAQGVTGNNGATGAQGVTGPQGTAGVTGPQGAAGANGADGKNAYTTTTAGYTQPVLGNNVSVSVVNTSWMTAGQAVFVGGSGGYYIVNNITNATTVVLTYLGGGGTGTVGNAGSGVSASGQTGAQGATGAQGNAGATGPQGAQGVTGPQGNAGATGAQGIQGVAGPTGAQGAQGVTGAQGNVGATGPQGAQGIQGVTGAQGVQGNVGATGPQGVQGNAGPTGAQGPTGLLGAGSATGNTTYWNGTTWVLNSSNIFNNGGNVGVGTTTPTTKLNVAGNGTALGGNGLMVGTLGASIATNVAVGSETGRFEISFPGWRDSEPNQIGAKIASIRRNNYIPNNALIQSSDLAFFTGGGSAGGNTATLLDITAERMRIDFNGNVGIGTSSPGFKLHVPSGYIGTDYINTTDNGSSGAAHTVTGIMVKAGDNYHRTADAASVRTYLGITAPTGDNLGNHTATTTLSMAGNVISNTPQINMTPGDGNGIRFWSDDNYKIHMGNSTEYHYGPVTDYSIKMNMNNQANRGWTWGVNGVVPIAALECLTGNMQINGTFTQGTSSWSASQIHFSSGWGAGGYHATIGSGYAGTTAAGIMLGNPHIPWRASYGAKMRYASDQAAGAYWDLGMNGEGGGATDRFDLNRSGTNFLTVNNGGNVGVGIVGPASKLHVMGKINLHQSGGGGGENRFEGLEGVTTANGRGQFVMSSAYSDLVIASSQVNDNHGSTLTFATYNPGNSGDYRKFVINQGNWGARRYFLDFGYSDAGGRTNPHSNINGTDQVMTLDGINKRVGIGGVMSPSFTLDVNGKMRARRGGYTMGNANEGQIEIGNAGSGDCFISFHREGAYGAQFGLASDNWFSTYGWSAGGGYTPIRMGSAQVNGDLTVTGTINGYIPNNGSGDWQIASSSGSTGYSAATLELRETNFAGGGQTPPHLGFHWGGVVASNIAIEADGTIAIRDNPGTGYEKFKCATIRTSGITETSDARLKKEVQPITNALATVLRLRGVNYKWKTNEELKSEKISYQTNDDVNPKGEMGFIAQEVEKILPELVNTDKEGFKSMEYSKMVALLVEAYKDLHKEHEQLQGQYGKQQQQIDMLFGQVQTLMQQAPANGAASIQSTITK